MLYNNFIYAPDEQVLAEQTAAANNAADNNTINMNNENNNDTVDEVRIYSVY